MFNREPNLAPLPDMVRYLAIFHRMFGAMDGYFRARDKEGILLGGWLADAMHNVPGMLWSCTADSWFTPASISEWLNEFVENLSAMDAPQRLQADAQRICSMENSAAVLELREDLTDADFAPLPEMKSYLHRLYGACVTMRLIRNRGNSPFKQANTPEARQRIRDMDPADRPPYHPWHNLEQIWTPDADMQAEYNQRIVTLLLPVPKALVHWDRFDVEEFRAAEERLLADGSPYCWRPVGE